MKKNKKKRYSLFLEAFRVNLLVAFTAIFIWQIIQAFDTLNPIDQMFEDFDYTDLYFSTFISKKMPPDTNVIIVNIGGRQFNRANIANQINVLQKYNPRVIGIDAVFAERKGMEDFMLKQALNQKNNIVMGVFGDYDKDLNLVGYTRSNPFFGEFPFGHLEFAVFSKTSRDFEKFITAYDTVVNSTCKELLLKYSQIYSEIEWARNSATDTATELVPIDTTIIRQKEMVLDSLRTAFFTQFVMRKPVKGFKEVRINAFTTEIIKMYDPKIYEKYIKRTNTKEVINYHGGEMPFIVLEAEEITDSNTNIAHLVKDKIVLLGYVKEDMYAYGDTLDSHFTPLRRSPTGHADAKGIEVHAHILSMILSNNYIDALPKWGNYLLAFIVTQIFLMLFCYLYVYKNKYFDVTTKPVQFIAILLILWLTFFVFEQFKFKIDMVTTVIFMILSLEVLYLYEETLELLHIRTYLTQYINFENDENKIHDFISKTGRRFRSLFKHNKPLGPKQ
ncbi:MAG TPA: CHASE2 domain-containing protein [Bacteroidales bacterium]|nr:CHASE2 domain-containing protein [Bacteroidales bacterium]